MLTQLSKISQVKKKIKNTKNLFRRQSFHYLHQIEVGYYYLFFLKKNRGRELIIKLIIYKR